METFSTLLALCEGNSPVTGVCEGNSPVTGEFPSQRPVTRIFDVSLIGAWTNVWVNSRYAGAFRRHRAHYDVTVMCFELIPSSPELFRSKLCWTYLRRLIQYMSHNMWCCVERIDVRHHKTFHTQAQRHGRYIRIHKDFRQEVGNLFASPKCV